MRRLAELLWREPDRAAAALKLLACALTFVTIGCLLAARAEQSDSAETLLLAIEPDIVDYASEQGDGGRELPQEPGAFQRASSLPFEHCETPRDEATIDPLAAQAFAEADTAAAAAWAHQLPEGAEKRFWFEQVAIVWNRVDSSGAQAWFGSLTGESARVAGITLANEAARTEPTLGLDLLSKLDASPERDEALAHCVSQWVNEDAQAALEWVRRVPEAPLRNRLMAAAAVDWAEQDGPAAAELAAQVLGPGDGQNRTVVAVVQRWAQASPTSAIEWVSRFPEGPLREAATQSLRSMGLDPAAQDGSRAYP